MISVSSLMRKRNEAAPAPESTTAPDYESYDWIVVSSSAGKDSQAMLHKVATAAHEAGVTDRLVVVHADLGEMEWPGTKTLAREQAERYGARFEVVTRMGTTSTGTFRNPNVSPLYAKGEARGDLLDHATHRAAQLKERGDEKTPAIFSRENRYCTSDHKVGPIEGLFTRLVEEWRTAKGLNPRGRKGGKCRLLDCQGLRAEESSRRAKKPEFKTRKSNNRVHIDSWLPIHTWLEVHVWDEIAKSGTRYHWAYDLGHETGASLKARKSLGMKRLSCVFCIFAPRKTLAFAASFAPRALLDRFVTFEKETGCSFSHDKDGNVWLSDIRDDLDAGVEVDTSNDDGVWGM